MSDVEDELLALAGDDVSSDEEEGGIASPKEASPSRSPSPPPAASKKKEAPAAKGIAVKRAPPKKAKKRGDDSEEEEGEASSDPGSPASQESVPMDESDSDSDAGPSQGGKPSAGVDDHEANQYPVDNLYRSHAERAEIQGMREIEREQILAERREEIERLRQNRMLRNLVVSNSAATSAAAGAAADKKRKASAADLEDGPASASQRKTSRVRTKVGGTKVGETASGIDSLRRAREERSHRMAQREAERDRRRDRSPSYGRRSPDRDSDADSEIEFGGPGKSKARSRTPEVREALPAELKDVERVRVGRSRFAEVAFFPGMEEALTGCYVRVNIGPDPQSGQDVYRMALIKGFTTGKPYAMPNRKGAQMVVDGYVKAAHGKAQREWPFISCSDGTFGESEWNRYKQVCAVEGVTIPKKPAFVAKIEDINRLVTRTWTDDELVQKLKRQNTLRNKFSGADRDRLARLVEEARNMGDEERASHLQEELDAMETPRLAFRTSLANANGGTPSGRSRSGGDNGDSSTPAKPMSQQDRLAELNRENRRRNAEAVRKAQLKEKARIREIEAAIERGEDVQVDESRRLKTRPKFLHDAEAERAAVLAAEEKRKRQKAEGGGGGSGANTPGGSGTPRLGALLPHMAKLQALQQQQQGKDKNGIPLIHKPLHDDDIIGALDLDIDIEI